VILINDPSQSVIAGVGLPNLVPQVMLRLLEALLQLGQPRMNGRSDASSLNGCWTLILHGLDPVG
jgi:hypothetical protein